VGIAKAGESRSCDNISSLKHFWSNYQR